MGRLLIARVALSSVAVRPGLAAQGRESPNVDNDVGLWLGVTWYALKDEVLNPLKHEGTFVSLAIGPTATLDCGRYVGGSLSLEVSLAVVALVSRPRWPILYKLADADFGWIVGEFHEDMTDVRASASSDGHDPPVLEAECVAGWELLLARRVRPQSPPALETHRWHPALDRRIGDRARSRVRGPGGPGAVAGCVLLRVQAAACGITEEDLKAPYAGFAPDPQSDGWVISTPEAEGMDRDAIEDVYVELFSDSLHPTAHSLLIVRHGFPGGGSLHP